jgi:uroporphyrinogen-III synthase
MKKILISQAEPMNMAPYKTLEEKYGVKMEFRPFFVVEPLTSREFRSQRLNILDYTAIVFSARRTIDAFFQICDELRVKIPDTMKYFCTTEAVAVYLQKHIVYRKRKIFFGTGTPDSVVAQIIPKHKDEKFLIATSDSSNSDAITSLFDKAGLTYKTAVFMKTVYQDLSSLKLSDYALTVFYNQADVKSLFENFPDYKPNTKFVTFGKQIVKAMDEAKLPIEIQAPTPEVPSVAKAIENWLEANK